MARSEERFEVLDEDVLLCRRDLETVGGDLSLCRREVETVAADLTRWRADLDGVGADVALCRQELSGVQSTLGELAGRGDEAERARAGEAGALRAELAALRTELREAASAQAQAWENRLSGLTLIRMPRWASMSLFVLILAATAMGWTSAALHWLP
jgi:hypothetical protein